VVAGNTTGLVAVDETVRESTLLAVPRELIAPVNVMVPEVPAMNVKLYGPVMVEVDPVKAMFAPVPDAPPLVVSNVTLAPRVNAVEAKVIDPKLVVILPFTVTVGVVPDPVYKIPTPPACDVVTVPDWMIEFAVTFSWARGDEEPIFPPNVADPVVPDFTTRVLEPLLSIVAAEPVKETFAPAVEPPPFVESMVRLTYTVIAALASVIDPEELVTLPASVIEGAVPAPVYKIPNPAFAVVVTVEDWVIAFAVTVREVSAVPPPTAPVNVALPEVPALTVRA
jgi:hypothetical protein